MKIIEVIQLNVAKGLLNESRSAPLYHFTSWDNLISILSSNQLTSPSGKIYLTRDYTRQFIPHEGKLFKQPYGIRIDQELLYRDYGRRLQAGGQDIGWDKKKRQAWLDDPKNAHEIEKVKQTGRGSGSRYDGADPADIVKGTVTQSRRWESEEHLNVKNLPNLDKYITGIVIGSAPLGSQHFSKEIDPDPLTKLSDILINLFSGPKGFDQRNLFLDSALKLGVPIVYERKEFSPEQVKKRIIQLYSQRKKEREAERGKAQQDFMIITSPAGGGIATGGSDIQAVFKKLSADPRYREKLIYGYSIGYGPDAEKKMFDEPIPLLQLIKQSIKENFADGRNPQDQGLTELNIPQTLDFIKQAHGDQLYGKLPYWRHPRAVAMTGKKIFGNKFNSDAVKVAFLHDVVEDTNTSIDELSKLDFSPQVIEAVGLLTKNKALTYRQNIENIINSGNPLAMMVKYADNYENYTGDKSDWAPARASSSQKKYLMSLNMLGDQLGVKHHIGENFADGRNPQDKGDSKRHGVPTKASVSTLRKVAKQGGRKGQLAHWMANMKAGRDKK